MPGTNLSVKLDMHFIHLPTSETQIYFHSYVANSKRKFKLLWTHKLSSSLKYMKVRTALCLFNLDKMCPQFFQWNIKVHSIVHFGHELQMTILNIKDIKIPWIHTNKLVWHVNLCKWEVKLKITPATSKTCAHFGSMKKSKFISKVMYCTWRCVHLSVVIKWQL